VDKGNLTSPLIIYNRSPARAESLEQEICNVVVASAIEEVVSKADIIFTCLTDDAAVKSTLETALKGNVEAYTTHCKIRLSKADGSNHQLLRPSNITNDLHDHATA
jgi:3-hydroxyisobutyrate dehydrogenase-like beta-hydroxyacid dehydrogenase